MSIHSHTSLRPLRMRMKKVTPMSSDPSIGLTPVGYIASGGNSSMILLHSLRTLDQEPKYTLRGHGLNVSTLHYSTKRRKLISGSWDKTARIWGRPDASADAGADSDNNRVKFGEWECEMVLEGHDEAVWGVLAIDEGPQAGGWLTASGRFTPHWLSSEEPRQLGLHDAVS